MLELSDRNDKISMMTMLKDLVENVGDVYEQMEKLSRGEQL